VHLHFTPTHTSWLNQIECWFSMYVFSAIGRLVAKIFADCYFPLASGKMTRY
jgi:transposase